MQINKKVNTKPVFPCFAMPMRNGFWLIILLIVNEVNQNFKQGLIIKQSFIKTFINYKDN